MEAKTYSSSILDVLITAAATLLFLGLGISYGFKGELSRIGLLVLGLGFASGVRLLSLIQTISVDASGILYKSVFKPVRLEWSEMVIFTPKLGSSFQIENQARTKAVCFNSQLNRFGELVSTLREKCPELGKGTTRTFHVQLWMPIFAFILSTGMLSTGVKSVSNASADIWEQLYPIVGAGLLIALARYPLRVSFLESELRLKSLTTEAFYPRSDISSVELISQQLWGVTWLLVKFVLHSGKGIFFVHLKEGALPFLIAAEEWLTSEATSTRVRT